jgi:hypothetical protein
MENSTLNVCTIVVAYKPNTPEQKFFLVPVKFPGDGVRGKELQSGHHAEAPTWKGMTRDLLERQIGELLDSEGVDWVAERLIHGIDLKCRAAVRQQGGALNKKDQRRFTISWIKTGDIAGDTGDSEMGQVLLKELDEALASYTLDEFLDGVYRDYSTEILKYNED